MERRIKEFVSGFYRIRRSWYCIFIEKDHVVKILVYEYYGVVGDLVGFHGVAATVAAVSINLLLPLQLSSVVGIDFLWLCVFGTGKMIVITHINLLPRSRIDGSLNSVAVTWERNDIWDDMDIFWWVFWIFLFCFGSGWHKLKLLYISMRGTSVFIEDRQFRQALTYIVYCVSIWPYVRHWYVY